MLCASLQQDVILKEGLDRRMDLRDPTATVLIIGLTEQERMT